MPRFFHASAAAVALALGTCALALPARAIDPNVLPADTEAVLTLNFRQLRECELVKSNKDIVAQIRGLADGHLAEAGVQRYLEKMDFDVWRDLDRVTVTTSGGKMPDFLILEGKFDSDKMQAAGEDASRENADHIKPIKLAGLLAYEIRVDANENPVFAGLVGKDRLIASQTKDAFEEAVSRVKNSSKNEPGKLKKELRDVLAVSGQKTSLSLVATGPALVRMTEDAPVPNIDQLGGVLQTISALSVSLTVDKNVNFELVVNSKDKKSTDEMTKLAAIGLAAAKLMVKKKAETDAKLVPALEIVESLRVTSQDNNLVLRGEITAETLGKVLKELPK